MISAELMAGRNLFSANPTKFGYKTPFALMLKPAGTKTTKQIKQTFDAWNSGFLDLVKMNTIKQPITTNEGILNRKPRAIYPPPEPEAQQILGEINMASASFAINFM